jgi:SAM-dependent methyltransferase
MTLCDATRAGASVDSDAWNAAQRVYWSGVAPVYDSLYRGPWSRLENEWVRSRLGFIADLTRPRVLDLGCGTGLGAELVRSWNPGAQHIGVDSSEEMTRATAERYGSHCLVGSMDRLDDLEAHSVDVVLALFSSVSFASSPERLFTEVHRVLRPGGRGYLSALSRPRGASGQAGTYVTRGHAARPGVPARRYSARDLTALALQAGLVDVHVQGMNALAGVWESRRLWRLGRLLAGLRPDWSHLIELTCVRPEVPS